MDSGQNIYLTNYSTKTEECHYRRLERGDIPEAAMGGSVDWRGLLLEVLPSKIEQLLEEVINKFQRSPAKITISIGGIEISFQVPLSPEETQNLLKEVKELIEKFIENKNLGKK